MIKLKIAKIIKFKIKKKCRNLSQISLTKALIWKMKWRLRKLKVLFFKILRNSEMRRR
jgi:hypothetical protein